MTIDILTGKNPKNGAERLNNIMNTEKYNAERLIRTETTHFYNQAELESYKECNVENDKIICNSHPNYSIDTKHYLDRLDDYYSELECDAMKCYLAE